MARAPLAAAAIHPMRCDCSLCPPAAATAAMQRIVRADPDARGDLAALAWGAISGAAVGAILLIHHFGPALVAALFN